jgi:hypothetical protein
MNFVLQLKISYKNKSKGVPLNRVVPNKAMLAEEKCFE